MRSRAVLSGHLIESTTTTTKKNPARHSTLGLDPCAHHIHMCNMQLGLMPTMMLERALLTVRNEGENDAELFSFCRPEAAVVASIQVAELDDDNPELANVMDVAGATNGDSIPAGVVCTDYKLLSPLKKGQARELVLLSKVTNHMVAYPSERKQTESPMVLATFPGTMLSMYEILEEKTGLKLAPSCEIKSKVSQGGRSVSDGEEGITLSVVKNVKPFTVDTMQLHLLLTRPLLRATSVERDIYVSHWGTVRFRETYDVRNIASSLKGDFSRAELLLSDTGYHGAALQLRASLPGGAHDIRYRDEIGNISTSAVARSEDGRQIGLGLEPRFPLFGGWHTKFELSYTLGINWLVAKGKTGLYEMVFVDSPTVTDVVYEHVVTRIHLPEGSKVATLPEVANQQDVAVGEERTFLSAFPRPVVTITQRNIITEPHIKDQIAEIKYSYQPWLRFQQLTALTAIVIVSAKLLALIDLEGGSSKVKKA